MLNDVDLNDETVQKDTGGEVVATSVDGLADGWGGFLDVAFVFQIQHS